MTNVTLGIPYFPDPTKGRPVHNGFIYVGNPGTDPEILGNQKQVSLVQEDGTIVKVAQPVRTNSGGTPTYNGSPVGLRVPGNYSLKVLNKAMAQVYNIARNSDSVPSVNVSEYGAVGDWDGSTGTDDTQAFLDAMDDMATTGGIVYGDYDKHYYVTDQVTVLHQVSFEGNGCGVHKDHTTNDQGAVFQIGNRSRIRGISSLTMTDTTSFGNNMHGLIKVGEFRAFINGVPQDNTSPDSSYYQVSDWLIEDITCSNAGFTLHTDNHFGGAIYIFGSFRGTVRKIAFDGTAGDGVQMENNSAVRTESGYDTSLREQGSNLLIEDISGSNIRCSKENAVVTVQGDRNTTINRVEGFKCGQVLLINTSGNGQNGYGDTVNQATFLQGKNGVNIYANNIIAIDSRIITGDTFTGKVAAVSIKGKDIDYSANDSNRLQVTVENVFAYSTETSGDKLSAGIMINDIDDSNDLKDANHITVRNFECFFFPTNIIIDNDGEHITVEQGYSHDADSNGATLNGDHCSIKDVKFANNNQDGATDINGFNGHHVRVSGTNAYLENCIFGNPDVVTPGSEPALNSVALVNNNATAIVSRCEFADYSATGYDVKLKTSVTGASCYLDQHTTSARQLLSDFPVAPDVAKVAASVSSTGVGAGLFNCTAAKAGTGTYTITFTKDFLNTAYQIVPSVQGSGLTCSWGNRAVGSITVYTKTDGGVLTDSDISVVIFGELETN